jgi:hypothetical protein
MRLDPDLYEGDGGESATRWEYMFAFLPWLALSKPVTIAGVRFIPFAAAAYEPPPAELADAAPFLRVILSGYVDVRSWPIARCTVACFPEANPCWNIPDGREDAISEAVNLLAFVGLAGNGYFSSGNAYTNSTAFEVYFQRLASDSTTIAVETRQRDGRLLSGGFAHGEWKFPVPVQCAYLRPPAIDLDLVAALDRAAAGGSVVLRRVLAALSFVLLANTDASAVLPRAEVVLMASAFEQLLDAGGAFPVSKALAKFLNPFGSVRVRDAMKVRQGITLPPEHAPVQEGWFVAQKWLHEFHNLRSACVHGDDIRAGTWGWSVLEHLVMAALVFPLVVRLLLAAEGHYTLTETDLDHCRAIDRLLAAPDWTSTTPKSGATVWQDILLSETQDRLMEEAGALLLERLTSPPAEE